MDPFEEHHEGQNNKKDKKDKWKRIEAEEERRRRENDDTRRAQLAEKEEALEKRRVAKLQVDGAKVPSKVSPLVAQLKDLRARPRFAQMPKGAKTKADHAYIDMEKLMSDADERVRGVSSKPFTFTLAEVVAAAQNANEQVETLTSIFAAYDKIA